MRIEGKGQIVEVQYNRYLVLYKGERYPCRVRGSLSVEGDPKGERLGANFFLSAGDFVRFECPKAGAPGRILSVYPRRNALVRPYVANLDALFVVIAPVPAPDWVLVDKVLLNCFHVGIRPVLCYNKADTVPQEEAQAALAPYRPLVDCVILSAQTGEGIEKLAPYVEGRFVAFAGQSAVGKTSLMSRILGVELATDGLTKWERGRHTTRSVAVYEALGGSIADTCGFSMLEAVEDVKPEELRLYYDEYLALANACRFRGCTHTVEPDCAVKRAVEEGQLDSGRYRRYLQIYKELKEKWEW